MKGRKKNKLFLFKPRNIWNHAKFLWYTPSLGVQDEYFGSRIMLNDKRGKISLVYTYVSFSQCYEK